MTDIRPENTADDTKITPDRTIGSQTDVAPLGLPSQHVHFTESARSRDASPRLFYYDEFGELKQNEHARTADSNEHTRREFKYSSHGFGRRKHRRFVNSSVGTSGSPAISSASWEASRRNQATHSCLTVVSITFIVAVLTVMVGVGVYYAFIEPRLANQQAIEKMESLSKYLKSSNRSRGSCAFPFVYNGSEFNRCIKHGITGGLWCPTIQAYKGTGKWGYCECKYSAHGSEYHGLLGNSRSGMACIPWLLTPDRRMDMMHNFCRNPLPDRRTRGPWCYVNENGTWEYCDVRWCEEEDHIMISSDYL